MSKLRPARSVRNILSQSWSRYSVRKPKKNYIKSLPHTNLMVFNMGMDKPNYDLLLTLNSDQNVQLRSNALEAARQVANKHLERELVNNFYFTVLTYPHNVIREKKRATGAGADRLSQGMSMSFGSPSSIAARVKVGQSILRIRTVASAKDVARKALKRASSKLSGTYTISMSQIPKAA
ncbi:MAG: 50S ribosomal protein L16 [Candidatus Micrarchaeaceae archaeon]